MAGFMDRVVEQQQQNNRVPRQVPEEADRVRDQVERLNQLDRVSVAFIPMSYPVVNKLTV